MACLSMSLSLTYRMAPCMGPAACRHWGICSMVSWHHLGTYSVSAAVPLRDQR